MTLSALHLVALLAVMAPQLPAMTVLQSTTGQPPSLPSPHQSQVTTMMTPSSSSSLTSSIKLMAINSNTGTNRNNYSNKRSPSPHDRAAAAVAMAAGNSPVTTANDEPAEDSAAMSGRRNATVIGMARGRSIGSGSVQNESQRRSYQRYRQPSPSPSASSSSVQQVQQQQQQQQQRQQNHFRRNTEPSAEQPIEHQTQTTKTPRMIQRLVGGHIQNAPSTLSTTPRPTTESQFRRKSYHLSSNTRSPKLNLQRQGVATTTKQPEISEAEEREDDDDAAFLDDPADFDNWDNGILRASAGSGKENPAKGKKKDDSKKTLSDQVRDGKYGLIEKELFRRAPKRPGVLSYLPNKEVPIDNERNYGGLNEEDIWLAEDHLLVIKGGSLNEQEPAEPWPPLDDYDAPGRQIKIPPNPKVPPPFPVQLEENGPIQFIGDSKTSILYPIANESISIYSTGQAAAADASDPGRDNEKNLLARPGTAGGAEKGKDDPNYFYPKPYPPWLFHNQTFVNPFLNARPIPFPGIGPFLNGSLGDFNGTDFDEDDPSLYYPPPYSFVYKSNYSNPVPPGPLVPGIVLPPPPDAFARLEPKSKPKFQAPTTTTTTTTTTELPFREILTKITEYTPQTIVVNKPKTSRPSSTSVPKLQPVPVQKEVYYTVSTPSPPPKAYTTPNPNLIQFVPTTARQPSRQPPTLSKSNPIYYEYYEARKEQPPTTKNYEFVPQPSPQYKPTKDYSKPSNGQFYYSSTTTERPPTKPQLKSSNRPQYAYEDYVYITPKPEIRPNGVPNQNYLPYQAPIKTPPLKNNRPYESFEREVAAIRDTLRFYQSQQLQDNSIPRTPKSKPVYDYRFESTKPTSRNFNPPPEYDAEPFKPMVTYSPPVDDANAFRAIAFEKADNDLPPVPSYYEAPSPVQEQELQPRPRKKIRVGAKYLQPIATPYDQDQPNGERSANYAQVTTPRTILTTAKPWITVEKQVVQEVPAPVKSARLQVASNRGYPGQFQGYYYNPPNRQNNRFYEEPFYQPPPQRKVISHRPAVRPQQQQQQQVWSLENDTYVNYAPNRPPLNPEAEFINPYQPFQQYLAKPQFSQAQRLPPSAAIQNQNPYYTPAPNRAPPNRQHQQQQQPISLHRDTLVNYRQPLPPINPDSEFINIPSRTQAQSHPQQLQQIPLPSFRTPSPIQYRDPSQGGTAGGGSVYVLAPQFRRRNSGAGNQ